MSKPDAKALDEALKSNRTWEAERLSDLQKNLRNKNFLVMVLALCLLAVSASHIFLGPIRKQVPFVISRDTTTGAIEVLQPFDNRFVGNSDINDKYWVSRYVQAREQYNWWLIGTDYETVFDMTDPSIFGEYGNLFKGDNRLDKVFGDFTERRIKVLSLTKSPTNPEQISVRFERTTVSKGVMVEPPTIYVASLAFRYAPKISASELELRRNPFGMQVYAYRRDAEIAVQPAASAATPTPSGVVQ